MKKFFLPLFLIFVLSMTSLFAGCGFSLELNGCNGLFDDEQKQEEELPDSGEVEDNVTIPVSDFELTLVKWRSFFIPTLKGVAVFDFSPSELKILIDDSEFYIEPISLIIVKGNYAFRFNQEVVFRNFNPGTYTVRIKASNGDVEKISEYSTTLTITEKLKLLNGPGGKLVLDNNAGWTPNM